MVWSEVGGRRYLMRSSYAADGKRVQRSLGPETPETQAIKVDFDTSRARLSQRANQLLDVVNRHAAICRALRLGRVPMLAARIIRAVDGAGLLGCGLRVLGTNALHAYEAAAGITFGSESASTEGIDFLVDARAGLLLGGAVTELQSGSFLQLLQRVDRSFERTNAHFRAVNRDGFLVDLIQPLRRPAGISPTMAISPEARDLLAVEIEGLEWHRNAPPFEAVALDTAGGPLRIVTSDPRVFSAHKLWLSRRTDREPARQRRDRAQAEAVAKVTAQYFRHLPYRTDELRMLPEELVRMAEPLFRSGG